ncbi:MAG: SpoIIIAH-like family protein [Eubacteriales bacterium]
MTTNEILNDQLKIDQKTTGDKTKDLSSRFSRLSSKLNRRNLIIFASIALIGSAVYLNWLFFSGDAVDTDNDKVIDYTASETGDPTYISATDAAIEGETDSYFAMTQLNRQRARDEAMEALQLVVDNPNSLTDLKEDAMQSMARIATDIATEANIESLVCAKGFEKCVAVLNENSASVVVKSAGLLPNEVIQIKEIVYEQSNIDPANIKIIEIE